MAAAALTLCLLAALGYFAGSGVAHRYALECRSVGDNSCGVLMPTPGFDLLVAQCVREFSETPGECAEYRKA